VEQMHRAFARNNVKVSGSGSRTIVLAHGLGCDQTIWSNLVARLEGRFRLVMFDHAGCGGSDLAAYHAGGYGSLDAYARDLIEVVAATCETPPIYVGHSVGNSIAVVASQSRALFERIVMLAPSPRFLDEPPHYRGGFTRDDLTGLLDLMDQNFMGWMSMLANVVGSDRDVAARMQASFRATNPHALKRFARVVFEHDVRALLPNVKTPTLVVQCARDEVVPVSVGEYMHEAIAGSQYRLVDVSGHCPHVSHAALVDQLICDFATA
jgi:sigma-B regulation protein RsbQ